MYSVVFGDSFLASAKRLGRDVQKQLNHQIKILVADPFHPKLHTKPLHGRLAGFYSFRVGRDYRVIFRITDIVIFLIKVSHRKEIYRS